MSTPAGRAGARRRGRPHAHVILFARAPRFGAVKRRLARDLGAGAAWLVYRRLLAGTLRELSGSRRWRLWLVVEPKQALGWRCWPPGVDRFAQARGDLGVRMAAAFRCLPPGPAVLVGSDIPGLRAAHVAGALRQLATHDAVFGPALDGGYWLVGFRRGDLPRGVFAGVRWSTAEALADSRASLPTHWRIADAATLADLDGAADLARWRAGEGLPR